MLVHCKYKDNGYHDDLKILFAVVLKRFFVQLTEIKPKPISFIKTYNFKNSEIKIGMISMGQWFLTYQRKNSE